MTPRNQSRVEQSTGEHGDDRGSHQQKAGKRAELIEQELQSAGFLGGLQRVASEARQLGQRLRRCSARSCRSPATLPPHAVPEFHHAGSGDCIRPHAISQARSILPSRVVGSSAASPITRTLRVSGLAVARCKPPLPSRARSSRRARSALRRPLSLTRSRPGTASCRTIAGLATSTGIAELGSIRTCEGSSVTQC